MQVLENKIAAITGGGSGIGKAIAKKFALEGAKVAILDINEENASKTVASLQGYAEHHHKCFLTDIGSQVSVTNVFEKIENHFGGIDILINAAAIAGTGLVEELTTDEWDRMFQINVRGTFICCKAALPLMKKNEQGRIINFASEVALRGNASISHYAASKAAVIAFSKCLALEVVDQNICVNTLSPGPTDTEMLAGLDQQVISKLTTELMPIGRLGRVQEIAAAALFLASDDASFCIGSTMHVNGGANLQ